MITHKCPGCKAVLAREREARKDHSITAVVPAQLEQSTGVAPRVKCGRCGTLVILLKGNLG